MDVSTIIFLSSGLFLGWSLGANDGANVFGTAVGSRMLRFGTAAVIGAVFVVLGAVISGAGATEGLTELGAVNAIAGAFMVALAAAVTVAGMTRIGMPVSTTQAIVGSIVGWNLFSGEVTDVATLLKIVSTWVAGPILGAIFAMILYRVTAFVMRVVRVHLLWVDHTTRVGLVLAGALGAYSLGANNVANVMGVFAPTVPFPSLQVGGVTLSSLQQLFLLGGIAMAAGLFYARRVVMLTVGRGLMPVNAVGAWVVVVAHSLVLLMFSSRQLESWLLAAGLPALPLVPVSSTQAVVGAVIGIGLARGLKGARQIRWNLLGGIALGWVATPLLAAVLCFFMLFFLQNVFAQEVYRPVGYRFDETAWPRLVEAGVPMAALADLEGRTFTPAREFRRAVRERVVLSRAEERTLLAIAEVFPIAVTAEGLDTLRQLGLPPERAAAAAALAGRTFDHRWQLRDALEEISRSWRAPPPFGSRRARRALADDHALVAQHFLATPPPSVP